MEIDSREILENYERVRTQIAAAAQSVGRDPAEIQLVVVTKGRPLAVVELLAEAGVKHFGENRVDEGLEKMARFSNNSAVKWHMIGHVQSRKAGPVVEHFNYLHSLDRLKLARRLDQRAADLHKTLPVLLQFNVSGEETKSGWSASDETAWPEILPQVEQVLAFPHLSVQGLMTMAPFDPEPENARPVFVSLRRLRDYLARHFPNTSWDQLSMGMSTDFQVGVQEGATLVRVGTAILGTRF